MNSFKVTGKNVLKSFNKCNLERRNTKINTTFFLQEHQQDVPRTWQFAKKCYFKQKIIICTYFELYIIVFFLYNTFTEMDST